MSDLGCHPCSSDPASLKRSREKSLGCGLWFLGSPLAGVLSKNLGLCCEQNQTEAIVEQEKYNQNFFSPKFTTSKGFRVWNVPDKIIPGHWKETSFIYVAPKQPFTVMKELSLSSDQELFYQAHSKL